MPGLSSNIEKLPRIALSELNSISELESIEGEWWGLWRQTELTPFQSPAWLIPWARHFTSDNLCVLTFRIGEELIAVAPFYRWEGKLFLLGNGISDELDLCFHRDYASRIAAEVGNWLATRQYEFNQLRSDSVLCGESSLPGDPCLVLALQHSRVPGDQITKLNYYRRRAAKNGEMTIRRIRAGEGMPLLFDLHASRWKEKQETGVLADGNVQAFHRAAADRLEQNGLLRLYLCAINAEPMGALYAFADPRQTFYYLSGFAPEWHLLSPGTLLIGHAIDEAMREGHRAFNFLRGQERYKYSWGAVEQPRYRAMQESPLR
jgi:CelD/BcsL family acetyltransferase involved in cellulose biosynthesis